MGRGLSNLVNAVDVELAAPVAPADLTITVDDATPLPDVPFYLVIDPFGDTSREYLYCTGVAGDVLTVLRDIEGSQDTTHASGDTVRISVTEQNVQDLWERTLDTLDDVSTGTPDVFDIIGYDPATSEWESRKNLANFGIASLPYLMASPYTANPAAGDISPNNSIPENVSLITVNAVGSIDPPFNDYEFLWDSVDGGSIVRIQAVNDPDSWAEWEVAAVSFRSGQYFDITIDQFLLRGSTYPPNDGTQLIVYVFRSESRHTIDTVAPVAPKVGDVWVDPSAEDPADSLPITGGNLTGGQALGSSLVRNMFVGTTAPGGPQLGDVWLDNS